MARWTRHVGVFTIILAICAALNLVLIYLQLGEMHSGGVDTHNLALAAHDQAVATGKLKEVGEAQAAAMDKLRAAGEEQAVAADKLRRAGEAQASATTALAENSSKQIGALLESARAATAQAESARIQSDAVVQSANATVIASKSTDRLAIAGKAQADALTAQLDLVKQQVVEAKAQTTAIASQTVAIQSSSEAAVRAAEAQRRAAELAAASQSPQVALEDITIQGVDNPADASGAVKITLQIEFSNNGGSAFVQKISTLGFFVGTELPKEPPQTSITWGGNDYSVYPGKTFHFSKPIELQMKKIDISAIKEFHSNLFIFGILNYEDRLSTPHSMCFAYRLTYRDGTFTDAVPSGGPAYHCHT